MTLLDAKCAALTACTGLVFLMLGLIIGLAQIADLHDRFEAAECEVGVCLTVDTLLICELAYVQCQTCRFDSVTEARIVGRSDLAGSSADDAATTLDCRRSAGQLLSLYEYREMTDDMFVGLVSPGVALIRLALALSLYLSARWVWGCVVGAPPAALPHAYMMVPQHV